MLTGRPGARAGRDPRQRRSVLVPNGLAQDQFGRETMTAMELSLRAATEEEIDGWLPRLIADYTEEIVDAGELPLDLARSKARVDVLKARPGRPDTRGQLVFRLLSGDRPVGWLWLVIPPPSGDPHMAWVNYITVDKAFRGRGYGRQAMLLAEQEARARGMTAVGLNVRAHNTVARSLYDKLDYQLIAQQMKKVL